MNDKQASARKFVANFHGDEIDGRFYALGEGIEGLDGATAEYLTRSGRISEITDEHFDGLEKTGGSTDGIEPLDATAPTGAKLPSEPEAPAETDEQRAEREAREAEEAADAERLEAAHAAFNAGTVPTDLLKEGTTELKTEADLRTIATNESVTLKSSMTKAEIAVAIMAARAKAPASSE